MTTAVKNKPEGLKIRGFSRIKIVNPDGSLHGDSGPMRVKPPNQVVNLGFNQYLVMALGSIAGSKFLTHMALGTGTQPAAAGTSLAGEVEVRQTVTAASSNTSVKLRLTATFNSGISFVTTTMSLSNIGLFNTSTQGGGTIFAGNTFASSTCASNQAVNATYDIDFS